MSFIEKYVKAELIKLQNDIADRKGSARLLALEQKLLSEYLMQDEQTCKCKDTLSVMIDNVPYCGKCNKIQVN